MKGIAILCCAAHFTLAGCASVPPESVALSQQVERNLATLKANNLAVLKAWRDLSVDYWSERMAREGPDMILDQARKKGITVDLTKDYRDLVTQVMGQFRLNFLNKIEETYLQYVDKVNKDFDQTVDEQRHVTVLLQSVVKLDADRDRIFRAAVKDLGLDDSLAKVQKDLATSTK